MTISNAINMKDSRSHDGILIGGRTPVFDDDDEEERVVDDVVVLMLVE